MTESFAGLVGPILQQVIDLRESFRRDENPSPEVVKRNLIKAFQAAQKHVSEAQVGDFALAQYALIYWVDEVLIKSSWRSADHWKNSILELEYFGTRQAAVDFWNRAKQAEDQVKIRGRTTRNADALETFFLCAALGFRGELFQDEAEIEIWSARVGPIIRDTYPDPPPPLPGSAGNHGVRGFQGERWLVRASLLVAITFVLTLLGFITAVHQRGV